MIFTFPAIASESVDTRYLAGIAKIIEQYFALHLVEAIMNGEIKFSAILSPDGKMNDIKMESVDLQTGIKQILYEQGIKTPYDDDDDNYGEKTGRTPGPSKPPKLEVFKGISLTPTTVGLEINIELKQINPETLKWQYGLEKKGVIIGTKVVCGIAKNVSNIYDVLKDDYYANSLRRMFKRITRWFMRKMIGFRFIGRIIRMLIPGKYEWYTDIFFTEKGFFNSAGWAPGMTKHQKIAASTVILNLDEEEDLFSDPGRVDKLFKMGWNSFVIIDPRNKNINFCSYIEGGYCYTLPIQLIFQALGADDFFKNAEELEKATGGFFRGRRRGNIKGLVRKALARKRSKSEQTINEKFEEYWSESGRTKSPDLK